MLHRVRNKQLRYWKRALEGIYWKDNTKGLLKRKLCCLNILNRMLDKKRRLKGAKIHQKIDSWIGDCESFIKYLDNKLQKIEDNRDDF